ncbi:MAG: LssY C-terminal domain-containing protein [Schlesneria sp.]
MPAGNWIRRLFFILYEPDPSQMGFLVRSQTQTASDVDVTVAVPDAKESERLFGVSLSRRGLQPIHLKVVNRSNVPLRLHFRSLDPHYFPPLEAAARCHFSIIKRLYAFGVFAWFLLPLVLLAPLKLLSIHWANKKMDAIFQSLAFHRRPIAAGDSANGFVFAAFDAGTKMVRVRLMATQVRSSTDQNPQVKSTSVNSVDTERSLTELVPDSFVDLTFAVTVPGINADYLHRKLDTLIPKESLQECDVPELVTQLSKVAVVTTNHSNKGAGDPINLVVIGGFETLLNAFTGRWDETEVISLSTCWKTARAFLLGSEYRYSPVSSLYLFGRSQDIALQQIRESISERLHLRLWLTQLTHKGKPVWIGQVSRDIGVRFTTSAWNLTTHRIDPDVDESRDYVLEDLLDAERVDAAGYVDTSIACTPSSPRRNLTGDPYYTDGKRVVILLSPNRTVPRFVAWS